MLQVSVTNSLLYVASFSNQLTIYVAGFSDPYCMLGILPGSRMQQEAIESGTGSMGSSDEENQRPRDKDKGFKKFSIKRKEKSAAIRDQLPAKYIQTTSVKPNTLNPVWNDKFRL